MPVEKRVTALRCPRCGAPVERWDDARADVAWWVCSRHPDCGYQRIAEDGGEEAAS